MNPKMKILLPAIVLAFGAFSAAPVIGQTALKGKPETDAQKFSYSLGFRIGSQISQQSTRDGIDVDTDAIVAAIRDALAKKEPRMSQAEMQGAMKAESEKQQAKRTAAAKANIDKGTAYRDKYAKEEGVKKTESGLLYKVMKAGDGKMPTAQDTVVVNYEGTLIDGKVFDSSYKRGKPATFGVGRVIPGWQEVLQLMKTGSTYEVVIPPKLAYGERGSGGSIPPNSTLKFKVELIEIKAAPAKPAAPKKPKKN